MRFLLAVLVALALAPAGARADGAPEPENCTYTMAYAGLGPVMLPVRPDGAGPAFTDGYAAGGVRVDVTVTLTVLDGLMLPIANFPAEDIWLQGTDGGLQPCGGGAGLTPDRDTDSAGRTVWAAPPRAGGHTAAGCLVFINGAAVPASPLNLRFTSPDINGDGVVNLGDAGLMSRDFYGTYAERSDFNLDYVINLSDIGQMAAAMGRGCP